jgi:hypothetical protein
MMHLFRGSSTIYLKLTAKPHVTTFTLGQYYNKLMNTERIGVFISYTTTTKQLQVYSCKLGYIFRSSKIFIDDKVN